MQKLLFLLIWGIFSECKNSNKSVPQIIPNTSIDSDEYKMQAWRKQLKGILDSFKLGLKKIIYRDTAGNIVADSVGDEMFFNGEVHLSFKDDYIVLVPKTEEEKLQFTNTKPAPSKFFTTGSKIEHMVFRDVNGTVFDTEKLKGKTIVLNYWFIKCVPCRREMPQLNEMVKEYESNLNIVFIGIALDDKKDLVSFLKTVRFDYHIVPDGSKIFKNEVSFFPTHVVVNPEGRIVFHCSESGVRAIYWIKKSIAECLRKS